MESVSQKETQEAQSNLVPESQIQQPFTPQPRHASLPDYSEDTSSLEKSKYASPAPPASSMTPPPSSQVPQVSRPTMRTPTPPPPHLSSPPPTLMQPAELRTITMSTNLLFSNEQVKNASPEELRSMVEQLIPALREARTSAAHYKLQYNMLCIDSQEATNRLNVELAMTQREVDVLQEADERRRVMATPIQSVQASPANASLLNELSWQCQSLRQENDELRDMLGQARFASEQRDAETLRLTEENDVLRARIRKNREHVNGILADYMDGNGSPRSYLGTPNNRLTATPRNRRIPAETPTTNRSQQPFEALLLADKVLSQEQSTTVPSTPTRAAAPRNHHTRGTHSLSAMPQTPNRPTRAGPVYTVGPPDRHVLRTPPNMHPLSEIPRTAPPAHYPSKHVRRASSDSTITASSVDEEDHRQRENLAATEPDSFRSDDTIPESHASQAATSMLRRTPQGSQVKAPGSFDDRLHHSRQAAAPTANMAIGASPVQRKLFGQVKKPGVQRGLESDKRMRDGDDVFSSGVQESPSKKGRIGRDAVGLGIGGLDR